MLLGILYTLIISFLLLLFALLIDYIMKLKRKINTIKFFTSECNEIILRKGKIKYEKR